MEEGPVWSQLLSALGKISLAEWMQIGLAFLALCFGSFSFGAWFHAWRARRSMRQAREAADAEPTPSGSFRSGTSII
jgi:hypothetical protein